MAHAEKLYKEYFLEYASYVIRDRAIPDLLDGFKPVQRRILHTMLTIDDGRYNKVAGVVGDVMKYHPHGDASIYGALVNIENDGLFIEGQGNYGNILTGDGAAAPRYIECRLKPFAKKVLYSPEITEYVDSYDGRNKEPVVFQAKVPVVAITGTSGIAVGMSTKILPHNIIEVLECQRKALRGEEFEIFPDFPTGGTVDVSEYDDGKGKVTVRAKLNASDPKKLVIEELPYETTSSALIESIKKADNGGKLKIASINDYTAEKANIEICWQRGVYSQDMVDILYATTDCQKKISVNPLVIVDGLPKAVGISDMIRFHADHLISVLTKELEIEMGHLRDKMRARTMERIFIEERIYKKIESKETAEAVNKAVVMGFKPFMAELEDVPLTDDDIERLLKIPIRRISLFDIEKNRQEIREIQADIEACQYKLDHIVDYADDYLVDLEGMFDKEECARKTELASIEHKSAKEVAIRNMDVRYDPETGYLGTSIKTGESLLKISTFDKIFYMKNNGEYRVASVTDKIFAGKEGIAYINYAEKDIISKEVWTIIYREKVADKKVWMIKRFQIGAFSADKSYMTVP
ncbi:MAG: DNA topoisomerase IV subunit A, partial [Spirochaetales bacterium]|nr:DNA topoisomerase IV subunit A [Candidatus Physcosoma equi]